MVNIDCNFVSFLSKEFHVSEAWFLVALNHCILPLVFAASMRSLSNSPHSQSSSLSSFLLIIHFQNNLNIFHVFDNLSLISILKYVELLAIAALKCRSQGSERHLLPDSIRNFKSKVVGRHDHGGLIYFRSRVFCRLRK